MPTAVNNNAAAIKQQLNGVLELAAQTNLKGGKRTARFRRTIESQPRKGIETKRIDLTKAAKIKEAPEIDVVQSMKKAVTEMNDYMHSLNKMVRFDLHEQSGRFFVRAVDYGNGREVGQFPSDAILKAATRVNAIKISDGLMTHKLPWLLIDKTA